MNGNGQESYFFECIQIVCVTISFVLVMFYCVPYISDTDNGIGCTLSSLDDPKHGGVADTPQGWDAIQRDQAASLDLVYWAVGKRKSKPCFSVSLMI